MECWSNGVTATPTTAFLLLFTFFPITPPLRYSITFPPYA
jgi:hypothetical protein